MDENSDIPGWTFEVEEVSFGVYRVTGHDSRGRRVVRVGVDPDDILAACRTNIREMLSPHTPASI